MHDARIWTAAALSVVGLAACAVVFGVDQSQLKECKATDYAKAISSADPPKRCEACSEEKCCGAVGRCGDEKDCANDVRSYLRCVAPDGGRPAIENEPACAAQKPPTKTGVEAYTCVRNSCGGECGLAGCTLDVDVPRLGPPACDACLGTSACDELNRCYKDRGCRTFVECLLSHDVACIDEVARAQASLGCDGGAEVLPACAAPCAGSGTGGALGDPCNVRSFFLRASACAEVCHKAIDAGAIDAGPVDAGAGG